MIGCRWICVRVWTLYKARERFPPFYGSRASSSLTSRAENLRQIFVKEKKISDDLSEIAEKNFGFFFFGYKFRLRSNSLPAASGFCFWLFIFSVSEKLSLLDLLSLQMDSEKFLVTLMQSFRENSVALF
jgi:hypothetical protein